MGVTWGVLGVRVELHCKEQTSWLGTESYYDSEARENKSRDTQFRGDWEVFGLKEWLYGDGMFSRKVLLQI